MSLTTRSFTPSPASWQDQVLYFLMIDRFSNGQETADQLFTPNQAGNAVQTEASAAAWRAAGNTWCGGNLQGIHSKLDYLHTLGVTTLWLSPILKQTTFDTTSYHGYGTQNFLSVDPRFGSTQDFQDVVARAHELGMYVILDIVVNHAGFVFAYNTPVNSETLPEFNTKGEYEVAGYLDENGKATIPFAPIDLANQPDAWPNGAIWPKELQTAENFNRRGCIGNWEDEDQYLHGDFKLLKDFYLGQEKNQQFIPSSALVTLTQVYQYWLAAVDLDGYRLDAVKHMEPGSAKYFVDHVHDFARSLGKQNFYIIGEVAGGQTKAHQAVADAGLDATLGILDIPTDLEHMVKGLGEPAAYFRHVAANGSTSSSVGSDEATRDTTAWQPNQIITLYDDHDQIRKNFDKARFAAGDPKWNQLAFTAAATLVCTAGIPCLYYGSEQGFDGAGSHDRYIRECMFGGAFGAFRSQGYHFFNRHHPIYQNLSRLLALRQQSPALRSGQQQLLEISGDGVHFGLPTKIGDRLVGVIPWLRWTADQVILCAFSTDCEHEQKIWIKLPSELFTEGDELQIVFSTNQEQAKFVVATQLRDATFCVQVTLPPAGFVLVESRK